MKKLIFGILMAFGLVSPILGYNFLENVDEKIQYVKEVVAELEDLKEKGELPYEAKEYLHQGKLFLEFAEKVKQTKEEKCEYAIRKVMSDGDNKDKYHIIFGVSGMAILDVCLYDHLQRE